MKGTSDRVQPDVCSSTMWGPVHDQQQQVDNGLTLVLVSQDNGEGHLYASALSQSCTVKEVKFQM